MNKFRTAEIKNTSAHDVASTSSQIKYYYTTSEVCSDNNKLLYLLAIFCSLQD